MPRRVGDAERGVADAFQDLVERQSDEMPWARFDLQVGVAYKEDLERVETLLMEIADRNPLCLEEPKPLFIVLGFGDSAINLQFSVWGTRENFLPLRNSITISVKREFDAAGIEIPFPPRTLYAGAATAPIPGTVARSSDTEAPPMRLDDIEDPN